jgi:uncharacterized cupredoxin-like copper-binding protein
VRPLRVVLVIAMALIVLLAACGGQEEPQVLTVRMSEFAFSPDSITIEAGREVQLTLVNDGALEHEFLVGRNPGEGFETDLFDRDASQVTILGGEEYAEGSPEDIAEEGYHVEVEPGGQVTLSFTVPASKAGDWEMGCFIDEGAHYLAGMHGTFRVTGN